MRTVYHQHQVSEQHESIHIVISISMGGWSIHFMAPIDLIDISTISWVFHCGLITKVQSVDNTIGECLSALPSGWTTRIDTNSRLYINGWLEYVFHWLMDLLVTAILSLVTHFRLESVAWPVWMPFRSVYHHPKFPEQQESTHIFVIIIFVFWRMNFMAPM